MSSVPRERLRRLGSLVIVACVAVASMEAASAPEKVQSEPTSKFAPAPHRSKQTPAKSTRVQSITLRLISKGSRLFVDARPAPRRMEYFNRGRRLGKKRGSGKTRFDISRYVERAVGGELRVVAFDAAGQRHEKTFDLSPYQQSDKASVPSRRAKAKVSAGTLSKPSRQDDGRVHPNLSHEVDKTRGQGSTSPSGSRRTQSSALQAPDRGSLYIEQIPRSVKSAATRPSGAESARITGIFPDPALAGQAMTLQGRNFGSDGDLYLEVAGLRLQPPVVRWGEREIEVELPVELGSALDGREQRGRVWVHTQGSGATSRLKVGPAPSSLRPMISRAPVGLRPAEEIRIEGSNFLGDRPGSVDLSCPGLRRTFNGFVRSWTDSTINVNPTGTFSGRIDSADCELIVRNHRGQEARHPARLEVHLVRDTLPVSRYWNFDTDGAVIEMGRGGPLTNGWVVVSASFSVDPDGGHLYEWVRRPAAGSPDHRVQIQGSLRNAFDRWDQRRRVVVTYTIEGPASAPLD